MTLSLEMRLASIQHSINFPDLLGLTGLQSALHIADVTHVTHSNASVSVGAGVNAAG
jgi:hypothetical protein